MEKELLDAAMALVERSKSVVVCSVNENGYPNAKAMLNLLERDDGLKTIYLSTNTSSRRAQRFMRDHRACLYFYDDGFHGLMLVGDMEVSFDRGVKQRLWREGFEMYYPKGVDDEDYCVLKFTAKTGNYYHGLKNTDFEV